MEHGYAKILEKGSSNVKVEIAQEFLPKDFFQSRDGLYVTSDFQNRIVEKASAVPAGSEYTTTPWDLILAANDATIESALPETHIFSESDVCAIIADLISKQPKGEEGALMIDGSWNLFYTPDFVVYVRWGARARRWLVDAWHRDDDVWDGGLACLFSRYFLSTQI